MIKCLYSSPDWGIINLSWFQTQKQNGLIPNETLVQSAVMRDNRKRFSEAAVELLCPLVEEHATPLILLHDKANKSKRRAIWTPFSQGHSQALKTGCIQVHHYKVSPGNNLAVLCDSLDIFSQVLYFHTKQGL